MSQIACQFERRLERLDVVRRRPAYPAGQQRLIFGLFAEAFGFEWSNSRLGLIEIRWQLLVTSSILG